jgi:hypothetical protein
MRLTGSNARRANRHNEIAAHHKKRLLPHSLIRLNSLVKHFSFVGAKHSIHRSTCMLLLAVVEVGTIIKTFQVTKKTQRGELTFSGGTAPECPRGNGPAPDPLLNNNNINECD